ncbi:MAG: large-conductance mechanosensitive channel protein MscL [Clostridia bacterium]|nr:large-conductance mechanosensitive channel protein MscL [Clostridia bacterium]
MFDEFKKFAFKGNVVDMAVGVIIGGAFGTIVSSLVNDIIMPVFGFITAGMDFKSLKIVLSEAVTEGDKVIRPEAAIAYGNFIQNIVNFLIISISIFAAVKIISKAMSRVSKPEEEKAPEPKGPTQEELLAEIRDLLKSKETENI